MISVLPALCRTFAPQFIMGALLKLVQDLLAFVSPQILRYNAVFIRLTFALTQKFDTSLLISFVEDPTVESWKGYLYAIVLTVTAVVQTLFLSQYFQRMFVVGLQIRTAVVSAIYRKVFR